MGKFSRTVIKAISAWRFPKSRAKHLNPPGLEKDGARADFDLPQLQDARKQLAGTQPHHRNVGCQLPRHPLERLAGEAPRWE
jgi:hypothetical protein